MKKQMLGMLLIAASSVLFSCEKQISSPEDVTSPSSIRGKTKKLASYSSTSCQTYCIDPLAPAYFYQESTVSGTIGNNPKSHTYRIWNDLQNFYVELTFRRGPVSSDGSSTVKVTVNGNEQTKQLLNQNKYAASQTVLYTFPLQAGWSACQTMNWNLLETVFDGTQLNHSGSYQLIGQCAAACEEAFSYVDNGNGTYTFSYTAKEAVTDAMVVFTFAQSDRVTVTGLEGWTNNGQTYQSLQSFAACETKTWTVGLTPKCDGAVKNPNLWTDFKVNEVSKKNDATPNITSNCN